MIGAFQVASVAGWVCSGHRLLNPPQKKEKSSSRNRRQKMRLILLAAAVGLAVAAQNTIYVAPNANTSGSGSLENPFSLAAARDHLRLRPPSDRAGTSVILRGGQYYINETFQLNVNDSGLPGHPVTYLSFPGEEARLTGGIEIPYSAFRPAPQRPGVQVADLTAFGITKAAMLGGSRGLDNVKSEAFLLNCGAELEPLQYAQDPKPLSNGTWTWAGGDDVVASGDSWFVLNNAQLIKQGRWREAANSSHGLSLFGHWGNPQGIQSVPVATIAVVPDSPGSYNISIKTEVNMEGSPGLTLPPQFSPGVRFVAIDSLELVTQQGEYWIDREHLLLYYYPVSDHCGQFILSIGPTLTSPTASMKHPQALVALDGTSWLSFTNISFLLSTQMLLSASNCEGLTMSGCRFEGAGASCLAVTDSRNSSIKETNIAFCGAKGLTLSGGNWNEFGPTLFASANLSVMNNTFHSWARWQRVPDSAGLAWMGVGHLVRGNTFRDAPEPAVSGNGNVDCIFEHNTIANVNYEQTDMGAYYHGSSAGGYAFGWTQPGNVIRYNRWQSIRFIGNRPLEKDWQFTTQAIYMDDELSGYTILGNHFTNVDVGVLIGGGRQHKVLNNTFESCSTACIHVDNRGMNWAHELCGCQCAFNHCVPGCSDGAAVGPGLAANFTAAPGSFRFAQGAGSLKCVGPQASPPCLHKAGLEWLPSLLEDPTGGGPCAPAHNLFSGNRFDRYHCPHPWQICGDIHNASKMSHNCELHVEENPLELGVWGSNTTNNAYASDWTVPVMPWPPLDVTSPEDFARWVINWVSWARKFPQIDATLTICAVRWISNRTSTTSTILQRFRPR